MTIKLNTAAIIGTNWGLIHLPKLRQAGIDVTAVVASQSERAQSVAIEQGIPLGTSDIETIGIPDVAIVATPARTHVDVLNQLPYSNILCEKPLVGWQGKSEELPPWSERLWVNYAYSKLHSCQAIDQLDVGAFKHVQLKVSANLPGIDFGIEQWFFEVASHPLSWLLHKLGEPDVVDRRVAQHSIEMTLQSGETLVAVKFDLGEEVGIFHEVILESETSHVQLKGCFVTGKNWVFEPVMVNDKPITDGEYSETDCWIDANHRYLEMILNVFSGHMSPDEALKLGGFNREKALWIEKTLHQQVPDND